jgi:hypothetical protein
MLCTGGRLIDLLRVCSGDPPSCRSRVPTSNVSNQTQRQNASRASTKSPCHSSVSSEDFNPDYEDLKWLQAFNAAHGSPTHSNTRCSDLSSASDASFASSVVQHTGTDINRFSGSSDLLSQDQFADMLSALNRCFSANCAVSEAQARNWLSDQQVDLLPPWHIARAVFLYWKQKHGMPEPPCVDGSDKHPKSSAGIGNSVLLNTSRKLSPADLRSAQDAEFGLSDIDVQVVASALRRTSSTSELPHGLKGVFATQDVWIVSAESLCLHFTTLLLWK